MTKHTIIAFLCLFFSSQGIKAQNALIQVSSNTRYEFTIINLSETTLNVAIANKKLTLYSYESKAVSNSKEIKRSPYLLISYPKPNFRLDTLKIAKNIRKELEHREMWTEIQEFTQGLSWQEQEEILEQYAFPQKIVSLYKKLYDFNEIYEAYSKNKKNQWTDSFKKMPIHNYVNLKDGVTPKTVLTIGVPITRKKISNFFEKKSDKISFDAHFAIRLLKDARLSKNSRSFLSLFAFANYERLGYRYLPVENSSVLVDGAYLNSQQANLTVLQNQNGINIFEKNLSTGAYLKLVNSNSGFSIDLGLGYDLANNIQLNFILPEDANPYLNNGDRLASNKIDNIAEKASPVHAILRLGAMDTPGANSKNLNRIGGLMYALSFKFFKSRQFFPTANYELYSNSQAIAEPQLIPLSEEKNNRFEMQLNFSIGITL